MVAHSKALFVSTTSAATAAALIASSLMCNNEVVHAMPSFGQKIPNGELVPCPESVMTMMGDNPGGVGCSQSGFCLGLGHPNCGGFQSETDASIDEQTGERVVRLNPFGEDFKNAAFVWTRELCQKDSDGDGYTNGEELGDPCCTWEQGQFDGPIMDSIDGWMPTHPGMKDDAPPSGFTEDKALLCGTVEDEEDENDNIVGGSEADDYYAANETRGEFEIKMKPYPIPIKTTTYTDFIFRLPDDLPDLIHIVHGEVINTQPKHLHHFVLTGCVNNPDESFQDGVPIDRPPSDCNVPIGGWAPGSSVFGNDKNEFSVGVALGRAMGIEALQLNVHYTDGEYEDAEKELHKMVEDGIKIYYTPDLRKYTSVMKPLIAVPYGPKELVVPPSTERYFLTRTCIVDTKCKDTDDSTLREIAKFLSFGGDVDQEDITDRIVNRGSITDDEDEEDSEDEEEDATSTSETKNNNASMMQGMLENLSCSSIKPFCSFGDFATYIQLLCPKTCGLCDANEDGSVNPHSPDRYRATSINYHAHLLGNEMYATLLRPSSDDEFLNQNTALTQKKQLDLTTGSSDNSYDINNGMLVKDLKSREMWYYDDQASIAMDAEYTIDINDDRNDNESVMKGVEIRPGDKIQVTCVYNSNEREEETRFGLSTYDEMCIIGLHVTFETPPTGTDLSVRTGLDLRSFSCAIDDENHTTDVWQGTLAQDEDPRNIWKDHPIESSDQCIFDVRDFVFMEIMTGDSWNCPDGMKGEESSNSICYGLEEEGAKVEFLDDEIAGRTCEGGTYDQRDSNEGDIITEKICIEEGGGNSYDAYTCSEVQDWLQYEASSKVTDEVIEYIRTYWYQPKCCRVVTAADGDEDNNVEISSSDTVEVSEDITNDSLEDNEVEVQEESSSSSSFSVFSRAVSSCIVASVVVVVAFTSI